VLAWVKETAAQNRFTHVDPFEDTESEFSAPSVTGEVVVSPTSIRSRILKDDGAEQSAPSGYRFTHVDPFEDTESLPTCAAFPRVNGFHPRRSVRGY